MNFNLKIIFVTLAILISSLLLNSFLSLASFEKIYVDSLISTTQIAGASLKVKIEQALKYGKPLDRFQNMDNLLEKLLEDDSEILSVGILLPQGKILYHTDRQRIGNIQAVPTIELKNPNDMVTRLIKGDYTTFVPLYAPSQSLQGYINLVFPRTIVTSRLKTMAFATLNTLWLFIPLTFAGLFTLVSVLIALPIKKDLINISRQLRWKNVMPNKAAAAPVLATRKRVNKDLDVLDAQIRGIVRYTGNKMAQFNRVNGAYRDICDGTDKLHGLEKRFEQIIAMEDTQAQLDQGQRGAVRCIMERQRHIRSLLDMTQNTITELLPSEKTNEQ